MRFNTTDGKTKVYLSREDEWTIHPTEDVAVSMLPLGRARDLELIAFERGYAAGRRGITQNKFYEGTPVAIIGYPIGMINEGIRNYPLVRYGHIGQIQGYLAGDPKHTYFLVAGSVFHGNSGGPVVVPAGTRNPSGMELAQTALIGMACAYRGAPTVIQGAVTSAVVQNADLTQVIPVDVIHETIELSRNW